ncbi:DUF2339 domain-containing protein [Mycolicibacterium thermoresistibile]
MTEPHGVLTRLSADFAMISGQLAKVSRDLVELDRILAARSAPAPAPAPMPVPYWPHHHAAPPPAAAPYFPAPAGPAPPYASPAPPYVSPQTTPQSAPLTGPPPPTPHPATGQRSDGWIGKALAVAGVAVTLIGVVMLLVLAAQAGVLRPEVRVGAGAVLAGALVGVAMRQHARPGGRIGAIALAATGVAAAYMNVIAVTTIYHWLPAPLGLVLAAVIGGGGLILARRWDSQHLGLLVLVPLIVLAPVLTDGVTVLLIAFMIALGAASLPVQMGRDWPWMHAARTASVTIPILLALLGASFSDERNAALTAATGIAAVLALAAALLLAPSAENPIALGLLTAAGTLPVLCVSWAEGTVVSALMAAALAAALLAIVAAADRLPTLSGPLRHVLAVWAAVAALVAVTVAFDGPVAGPVLSAMALVVAVAANREPTARWIALGLAVVGGLYYLGFAPPHTVLQPTAVHLPTGVAILIASVLIIGCAVTITRSWQHSQPAMWVGAAAVIPYAVTAFTVTAGVLIAGVGGGFFAGHMAATICWITMAAALLWYAARRPRDERSVPLGGGLALVAAAVAKLFLFDLGTLDGIFRVVVFIVVGLALLSMGGGYARYLTQQNNKPV